MGGLTFPGGDFNQDANLGWNVGGPIENPTHFRLIDGTANALLTLGAVRPHEQIYLSGGAGLYFGHAESDDHSYDVSITRLGLNGGAGVKIDGPLFTTAGVLF